MCVRISIIVPVFNVRDYIAQCANSLFSQTLNEGIEFIFVDDCSTDDSITVLKGVLNNYPERQNQVKILANSKNMGVSATRQKGLENAHGEYIIHCDPDDWVETNMYELLYNEAIRDNSDMVVCDYYIEYPKKTLISVQKPLEISSQSIASSICGRNNLRMHGSLCNKLIRHSVLLHSTFNTSVSYCEDILFLLPILESGITISYINNPLYHYRVYVSTSLVNHLDKNSIDNDLKTIEAFQNLPINSSECEYRHKAFIATILLRQLRNKTMSQQRFSEDFSRFKEYIKYNVQISKIHKILLWIAFNVCATFSRSILLLLSNIKVRISS